MGKRGPAGTPTGLRLLHGDHPERVNKREPKPLDGPVIQPEGMSAVAAAEWARVVPELVHMGVLKDIDRSSLEVYCEAYATWKLLQGVAMRSGPLIAGRENTMVKNPIFAQRDRASAEVRLWAREFGLTASARSALTGPSMEQAGAERYLSG